MQPWLRPVNIARTAAIVVFYLIAIPVFNRYVLHREAVAGVPAKGDFGQHNTAGNHYYEQHQFPEAIAEYSAMIELKPDAVDGWLLRSIAFYRLSRFTKALADETQALSLAKDSRTAAVLHYNRACCYGALSRFSEAIDDYNAALELGSGSVDIYRNRGKCCLALGRWQSAISDFSTALAMKPEDAYSTALRADAYLRSGNNAAAVADYKRACQYNDSVPQWWGSLGWAQYLAGQEKDSIASSRRALALAPGATYVRYNIGLTYAVLEDAGNARKEYEETMAVGDPASLAVAVKDVEDALQRHPHSATLLLARQWLAAPGKK